ncbi:MAG: redox-sensing transcriptional repressor Rex [Anaerolineae bacterium]|jgi:redox-sensing transcriptional repressor|nr:redox-sensing transcriptional repressor Rex [Anaerolineae bacterium]
MASNGHESIPDIVIGRLPIYLRALNRLAEEGQEITSSHELGQRLGISSAQIRKDLSHFGGFGKQGTGYQIGYLQEKLRKVLNIEQEWEVALVGIGDLGKAIAHYRGFGDRGFHIACLFDSDPDKVGQTVGDFTIQPLSDLPAAIESKNIRLAMVAVPAPYAQEVTDLLVKAGIKGILNYAPINLSVPAGVQVQYIDPVVGLQRMTFYLND